MRRRYSSGITLVGKSSLLKEGLAGILRAANFRILTSVSCAHDLPTSIAQPCPQLFLIVHTGGDFDAAVEQIAAFINEAVLVWYLLATEPSVSPVFTTCMIAAREVEYRSIDGSGASVAAAATLAVGTSTD